MSICSVKAYFCVSIIYIMQRYTIYCKVEKLLGDKKVKGETLRFLPCTQSRDRTGTGFTPLVFETSASTYSAIWAF